MAHEPYCNCCGCSQLPILDSGFIESLNTTGKLIDYPTSSPTEVTVVDAGWQFIGGRLVGGKSKLDLGASQVSIVGGYVPLLRRGASYIYQSGNPPQQSELQATANVSLYDNTEATFTAELVSRELPEGWDSQFTKSLYAVDAQTTESAPFFGTGGIFGSYSRQMNNGAGAYSLGGWTPTAFWYLPEPALSDAYGTLPAAPGVAISDFTERPLAGIESAIIYTENVSFVSSAGWSVLEAASSNASLEGFDLKVSLELGQDHRLVTYESPFVAGLVMSLGCVAEESAEDVPTERFFTAWVGRGARTVGVPQLASFSSGFVLNWPSLQYKTATIYRNGEQVFSASNPSWQQLDAVTEADGVYLTVTEVDERSTPGWSQAIPDLRRRFPCMLKDYSSFVVDSVKPVIGFTPPNDIYIGPFGYWTVRQIGATVMATEPVNGPNGIYAVNMVDESPSEVTARPLVGVIGADGNTTGTKTYSIGTADDFSDIAGNKPDTVPAVQWTVHSLPSVNSSASYQLGVGFDHKGSTPLLEDPGLQTREHWRPRLDTEPVSSLTLTFNRKVNAEQVDSSQLTLTKNGTAVNGCTLEHVDDGGTKWRVTIPTAEQTPRSFWILTYDPAGQVYTDDVAVLRFQKRSDFPETGKQKTIYIYKDEDGNDVRFSYGRALGVTTGFPSYVLLGENDPPIDFYGTPYDPEPCVLATRVSWLMADMNGYPRAIDTGYTTGPHQIGRVASVSELQSFNADKKESTVAATGGVYLDYYPSIGTYSPLINHKGYTPSVPSLTSPADDCSYFGLTTTIDPSPPGIVSKCASPATAQKHASAIRCDGDIEGFEITLVSLNDSGQPQDLSQAKYTNFTSNNQYQGPTDFSANTVNMTGGDYSQGTDAAAFLMARSGQKYTFGKTLAGDTLSQNVWACVDGSRNAELPVRPAVTRHPDGVCPTWSESLYSVGLTYGPVEYSSDDVRDWPNKPGLTFENYKIIRNGEVIQGPEKLMPGDVFWANNQEVIWWPFRQVPYTRQDWRYRRGSASGIVRQLASGALSQAGLQGCFCAYRAHKQFPGLKTTTLGELCLSVSLRMTIQATLNYADRRLQGKYYTYGSGSDFGGNPYTDKCGNSSFDEVAQSIIPPRVSGTKFIVRGEITEWASWDEGESIDEKTVAHQFLGDINDSFALSKEKEAALANGQEIFVSANVTGYPGNWYWKIKKA